MDIFKEVSSRADILKVCGILGIKLDRHYKCLCPFSNHNEKTASFSVLPSKNIFYCFGCGKKGNSITLVKEILNTTPLEAARYINEHLALGINIYGKTRYGYVNRYEQKEKRKEDFKKWENEVFQNLCDYNRLLEKWKKIKDINNDLYVEALQNTDYLNYVIDEIFINGTDEDKVWFRKENKKYIKRIQQRIQKKEEVCEQ